MIIYEETCLAGKITRVNKLLMNKYFEIKAEDYESEYGKSSELHISPFMSSIQNMEITHSHKRTKFPLIICDSNYIQQ